MPDNGGALIAWSAGVSAIGVGFAGILAARATTPLSQNPWFISCVVIACLGFAALMFAGLALLRSWWRLRQAQRGHRNEQKQGASEVVGQLKSDAKPLPRVREVKDRALLGIHPAIPLPSEESVLSREFPLYVLRDLDPELDDWIEDHRESGGFLLLVGPAAAGKTRTAYELIQRAVGDWRLFMPGTSAQLTEYIEKSDTADNLVVWVNEVQNFLGPDGLESGIVRQMLAATRPVLLIGTIWPDRYEILTDQLSASDLTDPNRDAREILEILADRKDLAANFTSDEYQRARVLAERDPRLHEVVQNGDHGQLAAILAAAPELVRRWVTAANPYGAAILTAAVFARICGHPALLPEAVLKSLASCFLTSEQRAKIGNEGWYADALEWCRRPVRGNVTPLIPQSEVIGKIDGDSVSDVLVQHGRNDARITSQLALATPWLHLIDSASPDACVIISLIALLRPGPPRAFEEAGKKAAEAGDIPSMLNMGTVMYQRGDTAQAEFWFARAAATGNPLAMTHVANFLIDIGKKLEAEIVLRKSADLKFPPAMDALSELLKDRGDAAEAEDWLRRAAVMHYPPAMLSLAMLLHHRGEKPEAEEWAREAAQAGDVEAMAFLGVILSERGEKTEAEAWLRKAARFRYPDRAGLFGHPIAMTELGSILLARGEREEAEFWWRQSARGGEHRAMTYLGALLKDRGEITEAERLWRKAAEEGSELSANNLGTLSHERGDKSQAERWWRKAADAGLAMSMAALAGLLNERGETQEAEEWWHRAAEGGSTHAMVYVGAQCEEAEETAQAERWWRKAADLGDATAMNLLGNLLQERGEEEQAEGLWLKAAHAGNSDAAVNLGQLYHGRGEVSEAEKWWRKAATSGNPAGMSNLAGVVLLERESDEAESLLRKAVEMGDSNGMSNLAVLLKERGEAAEAEPLARKAVAAGHSGAMANLGVWLQERGEMTEAERWLRESADMGHPRGMYYLGKLLYGRGESAEAEMWRQRAVAKRPDGEWPEYSDGAA
jgi:TPR repeat protein